MPSVIPTANHAAPSSQSAVTTTAAPITPALVREVTAKVYALLRRDLQLAQERQHAARLRRSN